MSANVVGRNVLLVRARASGGIRTHVEAMLAELQHRNVSCSLAVLSARSPLGVIATLRNVRSVDVVHAHGLKAGALCAVVKPKRLVVTVHNVSFDGQGVWRRRFTNFLERIVVQRAQAVIATSRAIEDELRGLASPTSDTEIVTIRPFGPVLAARSSREAVRAHWRLTSEAFVVLCLARLHEQKDVATLIEAWKLVVKSTAGNTQSCRLVLVGDGPQRSLIHSMITDYSLDDTIVCEAATDDVASYYNASDVVVCTSIWESGPLVVLEAALSGKAIVTTVVGNVDEYLVDGESAIFVAHHSADDVARALLSIASDRQPSAELGRRAQEHANSWFNRSALVDQTISMYDN